ncbi:MAG: hypothetical protein EA341_08210 [Mongoliibacter sp.]|uniref:DUF5615 family PIN-like protein n=1 Tax=Mongoliibacter sp. TaxID=2022438 RepID=UPI0012EFC6AC|nr:DUF5615 family PIN-like protein [Mongoliibacter sp.]TVP50113.1 MAG: hypothetical protein EA341_08210 [Mongoliibacter sp.]
MKLLFDQNISFRILKLLHKQFDKSSTIKNEGLINATDKEIWDFARINGYVIVTQDADFSDLNSLYGFPPKIIWIRTGNLTTSKLANLLSENREEIYKFIDNKKFGSFEIVSFKNH